MRGTDALSWFTPPEDFELKIRGGPILPADIVGPAQEAQPLVAEPERYVLVYSPVTPSGQKVALVAALYGLLDVVSVLVPERGRLVRTAGEPSQYRWSTALTARERRAAGVALAARTPALVDTASMSLLSNDPYRLPYEFRDLAQRRHPHGSGELSLSVDVAAERYWDERIFMDLHVGVYRSGFAASPELYARSVAGVHGFLADIDERLGGSAYLLGDRPTPPDVWLFSLLIRFDQVYGPGFRLHRYRVRDFANVWRYLRDLYHLPACSFTTDFAAISAGYFLGIPALNRGIVPVGPDDVFLRA